MPNTFSRNKYIMNYNIHQRGYYLSDIEHCFDESLCSGIADMFKTCKAVDIGCGDGRYVKYLNEHGIQCRGYDGNPDTANIESCDVCDFSRPVNIGFYDLVLCLEVGEHIPAEFQKIFLDNVAYAADNWIVLSWAIKGQGGHGHVNCQDNWYIIREMRERNFEFIVEKTKKIRDASTIPWFKNTLMVYQSVKYRP